MIDQDNLRKEIANNFKKLFNVPSKDTTID